MHRRIFGSLLLTSSNLMEETFPFFSISRQALIVYIIHERILLICILSLVGINWHLNQLVTDPYQPLIQVALTCGNTEVSRFFSSEKC